MIGVFSHICIKVWVVVFYWICDPLIDPQTRSSNESYQLDVDILLFFL